MHSMTSIHLSSGVPSSFMASVYSFALILRKLPLIYKAYPYFLVNNYIASHMISDIWYLSLPEVNSMSAYLTVESSLSITKHVAVTRSHLYWLRLLTPNQSIISLIRTTSHFINLKFLTHFCSLNAFKLKRTFVISLARAFNRRTSCLWRRSSCRVMVTTVSSRSSMTAWAILLRHFSASQWCLPRLKSLICISSAWIQLSCSRPELRARDLNSGRYANTKPGFLSVLACSHAARKSCTVISITWFLMSDPPLKISLSCSTSFAHRKFFNFSNLSGGDILPQS